MPRVEVSPTDIASMTFVNATATAGLTVGTADNITFPNDGDVFLWVHNSNVASKNVTIVAQGSTDGADYADEVVAIGAGLSGPIGPFNKAAFNVAGKVQVNWHTGAETDFYYKLFRFRPL